VQLRTFLRTSRDSTANGSDQRAWVRLQSASGGLGCEEKNKCPPLPRSKFAQVSRLSAGAMKKSGRKCKARLVPSSEAGPLGAHNGPGWCHDQAMLCSRLAAEIFAHTTLAATPAMGLSRTRHSADCSLWPSASGPTYGPCPRGRVPVVLTHLYSHT